ncbi:MAG: HEPN domain-containing protein [Prevotellaceae bacterium]|jgi:HEPN domain-containing protein|nr:HEPN domain-containing protein [Prevotellaceae bacterium]
MCSESSNLDYSTSEGGDAGGSKKKLNYEEWLLQSDYDLEVADSMLTTGRNIYCVFMCHLSLEKALKGLYIKQTNQFPSKMHNLMYFVEKIDLNLPEDKKEFLVDINKLAIVTRYPEDLRKMIALYTKEQANHIYQQAKAVQQWLKIQ